MQNLTLDYIQSRYEAFEAHAGIIALNKAIDKILFIGQTEREAGNGSIVRQWINGSHQKVYEELVDSRADLINREFSDIKQILEKI